jgi:hypothetical protein
MAWPMHVNRGLIFWGLALVTAGVVALAASQGWIDRSLLIGAWRLWPLILIVIGLAIVLSRTPFGLPATVAAALVIGTAGGAAFSAGPGVVSCGGEPASFETSSGDFTEAQAAVDLDLNCGDLAVDMADGGSWEAVTGDNQDDPPMLEADGSSLQIRAEGGGFPFRAERQDWTVTLGQDVTYELSASLNAANSALNLAGGSFATIDLDPNAGAVDVDLSSAQVSELRVSLNAGSLALTADAETDLAGSINVNAGSVELCAPEGALRITISGTLNSNDLDESTLIQSGDTFTGEAFAAAAHTIDLLLEGNAASFSLNPEDGCE